MSFDYGDKLSDGQHEFHPTNNEGEFVAPIRNVYVHETCNGKTRCGDAIAETYAKNPTFYNRTFCSTCGDYYPLTQFTWAVDGVRLGSTEGIPGEDLKSKSSYLR